MQKMPETNRARVVADPNNEPVRVVDQVSFHPPISLDLNLTAVHLPRRPLRSGRLRAGGRHHGATSHEDRHGPARWSKG